MSRANDIDKTGAGRPVRRCAIYTRKSSEEGLEQDFNSLDAQREACAAYIQSQQQEGWTALPTVYDDGLLGLRDVYFEAGGHADVVWMRGPDYLELLASALHGSFSQTFERASVR